MNIDKRYFAIKAHIESGRIKEFKDILDHIPPSVIAKDINTTPKRLTNHLDVPYELDICLIYLMSLLFDIPFEEFNQFILKGFVSNNQVLIAKIKKAHQ